MSGKRFLSHNIEGKPGILDKHLPQDRSAPRGRSELFIRTTFDILSVSRGPITRAVSWEGLLVGCVSTEALLTANKWDLETFRNDFHPRDADSLVGERRHKEFLPRIDTR